MIEEFNLKHILGTKPGDHQFLFEQLDASEKSSYCELAAFQKSQRPV
jgi:hypothetical protein